MGVFCKTTSFWDGAIHKSKLEPVDSAAGPCLESWRYMDGGMMVRHLCHQGRAQDDLILQGCPSSFARCACSAPQKYVMWRVQ